MTLTPDWLRTIAFDVRRGPQPGIDGVVVPKLTPYVDGRGDVTELWSAQWEGEGVGRTHHVYQSVIDLGVVKSWHGHLSHTDQFVVTRGKLQLAIADVREASSTFRQVNVLIAGSLNTLLVQVPPGVMHGWKALSRRRPSS